MFYPHNKYPIHEDLFCREMREIRNTVWRNHWKQWPNIYHHERCVRLSKCANTHFTLHWRHNDHDGVSNHQHHGCLINRLFRRRSKKTSKRRVAGLCVGNSPRPVNFPHKGPVTRKMFPFEDVIMYSWTHIPCANRRWLFIHLPSLYKSIMIIQWY